MFELTKHKAYELLKTTWKRVSLDYVILSVGKDYEGYSTHKLAVIEAFRILELRLAAFAYQLNVETDNMKATKVDSEEFLMPPSHAYYEDRSIKQVCINVPTPMPYWYAFLEPPYGTPYVKSDFIRFHEILFPNRQALEVYRWNDDFSNYFDAGKEWWGTGLWSAYDRKTGTMVVIGASQTD